MLFPLLTGNVEATHDLILINSLPIVDDSETSLLCITSRWRSPDSLTIGRDYEALMSQHQNPLAVTEEETRGTAKKVVWQREHSGESIGAYYCEGKFKNQVTRIHTMKMQQRGRVSSKQSLPCPPPVVPSSWLWSMCCYCHTY